MPHSSDDLPSVPPAESTNRETPAASVSNAFPENVSDSGASFGPAPQEGEPRRRRRRRRRRPSPPPAAELAAAGGIEAPAEETAPTSDAAALASAPLGDHGSVRPPFRRSRRRRPPRQTSPRPALAEGSGQAGTDIPADGAAEGAAPEGPAPQEPSSMPASDQRSSEHRRRRRRPVREGDGAGPPTGSEAGASSEAVVELTSRGDPAPSLGLRRVPGREGWGRMGRPRNRRPREPGPRQEPRDAGSRQQRRTEDGEPRATSRREPDRRERTSPRRGVAGRNAKTRPTGRGREAAPRKPEQKLYALESIVDRGFEDVTDEADESTTRRVHWTIVKRTVADQKSGKPMSAVYVLQREGVEAQFPNLGAARAAVNKTIIHPEKLTVSKAEHAAERAAAKK